jgi:hypothetical protein
VNHLAGQDHMKYLILIPKHRECSQLLTASFGY